MFQKKLTIIKCYIALCIVWCIWALFFYYRFLSDQSKSLFVPRYLIATSAIIVFSFCLCLWLAARRLLRNHRFRGIILLFCLLLPPLVILLFKCPFAIVIIGCICAWVLGGGYGLWYWLDRGMAPRLPYAICCLLSLIFVTIFESCLSFVRHATPINSTFLVLLSLLPTVLALWQNRTHLFYNVNTGLSTLEALDWSFIAGTAILIFYFLLSALTPGIVSDAARAWLPLLKYYAFNHGHVTEPWSVFSLQGSAFTHLLSVPFLLFGEPGARIFLSLLTVLFMLCVIEITVIITECKLAGYFVAYVSATIPMLYWLWFNIYHDALTYVFCVSGFLALLLYTKDSGHSRSTIYPAVSGLLLGFACAGKLTAIPFAGACGIIFSGFQLWQMFVHRDSHRHRFLAILPPMFMAASAMLLLIPYLGRVFLDTGNPFFPLGTIKSFLVPEGSVPIRSVRTFTLLQWLLAPYNLTFNSFKYVDSHLNGSFGPWLWCLFPFLIFTVRKLTQPRLFVMLTTILTWVFFTIINFQNIRGAYIIYILMFTVLALGISRAWSIVTHAVCSTHHLKNGLLMLSMVFSFGFMVTFPSPAPEPFVSPLAAKEHDPDTYESYFPGFKGAYNACEALPKDAIVAVRGPFQGHLPRPVFEYASVGLKYFYGTSDYGFSRNLLLTSNASAIIIPHRLLNWPDGVGWREAKRLVLADEYCMFLIDDSLLEPCIEIAVPTLNDNQTDPTSTWSLSSDGDNATYTLEMPILEDTSLFTVIIELEKIQSANIQVELIDTDDNSIAIPCILAWMAKSKYLAIARQSFSCNTKAIRFTLQCTNTKVPPDIHGSLCFYSNSRFPALEASYAAPPLDISTKWQNTLPLTQNNIWYCSNQPQTAKPQDDHPPLYIDKNGWMAYRFDYIDCERIVLDLDVYASHRSRIDLHLRTEGDDVLGSRISSITPYIFVAEPGYNQLKAYFNKEKLPRDSHLVLIVWPPDGDQQIQINGGKIYFYKSSINKTDSPNGTIKQKLPLNWHTNSKPTTDSWYHSGSSEAYGVPDEGNCLRANLQHWIAYRMPIDNFDLLQINLVCESSSDGMLDLHLRSEADEVLGADITGMEARSLSIHKGKNNLSAILRPPKHGPGDHLILIVWPQTNESVKITDGDLSFFDSQAVMPQNLTGDPVEYWYTLETLRK